MPQRPTVTLLTLNYKIANAHSFFYLTVVRLQACKNSAKLCLRKGTNGEKVCSVFTQVQNVVFVLRCVHAQMKLLGIVSIVFRDE